MSSQGLQTVDRAIRSLLVISDHAPISAVEVAERLGMPLSTTYRYIATLRKHGLVRLRADQTLTTGPRCVQLERSFRRTFQKSSYREVMEQVSRESGETVALLVPIGSEAICIDAIDSTLPLRYAFTKGNAGSLLLGASAKVMLPWLDRTWVDELIDEADELSTQQKERLRGEIPKIKEEGYATSIGEVDAGVWTVAAPVFKQVGVLDASLSVIAPHFRVEDHEDRLIELTTAAAAAMTEGNYWEAQHDH